jgi:hypothetical protein
MCCPTSLVLLPLLTTAEQLLLNPSEQAAALAKGLDHISSLVSQSRMWEELYVRRYESQTTVESGEQAPPASLSHSEYKNALEMLYVQILKFRTSSSWSLPPSRVPVVPDGSRDLQSRCSELLPMPRLGDK